MNAEYLIAMIMVSAREYRNDISDIVGILIYLKKDARDFSMDKIDAAIQYLYGERKEVIRDTITEDSIDNVIKNLRSRRGR